MAHVDRPMSRAVLAVAVATVALLLVAAGAPWVAGQTTTTTVVDPDSWADHGAACAGTVEECVDGGGGGMARRELGYGGYISYDAMSRGRVPCSYRGASYYNCRPGAPANPYSRGCSAITRCRG
ncbi:rapid alkalinization factor-like [Miscanthus floridulus]|uniref:rapid alkalinization factor-like n=1 Tax=Miscanthus floridulus TaxID=154761 RepID=UPI0034578D0E